MRKGAAELAVLNVLSAGEHYGLQILQALAQFADLQISEGSIYPLLKRLEKGGRIVSHWRMEQGAAHPRKYYALTTLGKRLLKEMNGQWFQFTDAMAALISENQGHQP